MQKTRLSAAVVFIAVIAQSWAATYHVDNTAASADDANAGGLTAPLKTISAGLNKAVAGDTVFVLAGTYVENVVFSKSGAAGKPIVLKGDLSKNACIRGADVISTFKKCTQEMARGNKNYASIYWTELPADRKWQNWAIALLNIKVLQDNQQLKCARWPVSAWFSYGDHYAKSCVAESGDTLSIVDTKNLAFRKGTIEGAMVTFYDMDEGISPYYRTITTYDSAGRRFFMNAPVPKPVQPGGDLYCLGNCVSLMSQPGEFAIDTFVKPGRLYLWPLDKKDPNACRILIGKNDNSHLITWASNVGYITIEGLNIFDAGQKMGIGSQNPGHHFEIRNCVLVRASIYLVNQSYFTITHCVQTDAFDNGINISQSNNISLVENEIFNDGSDGIAVGSNSKYITILRNYIHDLWDKLHPDGIQLYTGTNNFFIDSNVIFNCGQGIFTSYVDTGRILNNMIIGTHGMGIGMGYKTATNIEVSDNTIFFNGVAPVTTDSPNNKLINNLIGWNFAQTRLGWRNAVNFTEDYNLFLGATDRTDTAMGSHSRESSGIVFKNGHPGKAYMVNSANVAGSTTSSLKFGGTDNAFKAGDNIEVNFDGIMRKVTAATSTSVSFNPPIAGVNPTGWDLVVNWKSNSSPAIDLRLADNSAGIGSGVNGTAIGSSLDIQAYRGCDFNGDGKRDVPVVPNALYKPPFNLKTTTGKGHGSAIREKDFFLIKNGTLIMFTKGDENVSFELFQLNGRRVMIPGSLSTRGGRKMIDLQSLGKGTYLWKMTMRGNERRGKVLLH